MEKENDNSSDEEYQIESNQINLEDLDTFYKDYEKIKKNYSTKPNLNKYEKTKILSERAQQLANGSISFLKDTKLSNTYDIALEELNQKKIPFIIKRPIVNGFEYWKLEDLKIL